MSCFNAALLVIANHDPAFVNVDSIP